MNNVKDCQYCSGQIVTKDEMSTCNKCGAHYDSSGKLAMNEDQKTFLMLVNEWQEAFTHWTTTGTIEDKMAHEDIMLKIGVLAPWLTPKISPLHQED